MYSLLLWNQLIWNCLANCTLFLGLSTLRFFLNIPFFLYRCYDDPTTTLARPEVLGPLFASLYIFYAILYTWPWLLDPVFIVIRSTIAAVHQTLNIKGFIVCQILSSLILPCWTSMRAKKQPERFLSAIMSLASNLFGTLTGKAKKCFIDAIHSTQSALPHWTLLTSNRMEAKFAPYKRKIRALEAQISSLESRISQISSLNALLRIRTAQSQALASSHEEKAIKIAKQRSSPFAWIPASSIFFNLSIRDCEEAVEAAHDLAIEKRSMEREVSRLKHILAKVDGTATPEYTTLRSSFSSVQKQLKEEKARMVKHEAAIAKLQKEIDL